MAMSLLLIFKFSCKSNALKVEKIRQNVSLSQRYLLLRLHQQE